MGVGLKKSYLMIIGLLLIAATADHSAHAAAAAAPASNQTNKVDADNAFKCYTGGITYAGKGDPVESYEETQCFGNFNAGAGITNVDEIAENARKAATQTGNQNVAKANAKIDYACSRVTSETGGGKTVSLSCALKTAGVKMGCTKAGSVETCYCDTELCNNGRMLQTGWCMMIVITLLTVVQKFFVNSQ